jgi:hypothetical protein
MAVFCSSLISCFVGMMLRYCLSDFNLLLLLLLLLLLYENEQLKHTFPAATCRYFALSNKYEKSLGDMTVRPVSPNNV